MVTLTNIGTAAASFLDPFGFATTGTNWRDFHKNPWRCGMSLAPGASCQVSVYFKPLARGARTGFFLVRQGAASVQIPLSGTAGPKQFFSMPFSGYLFLLQKGGEAGASSDFGLGTSPANFVKYYGGLPNNPQPVGEVLVGHFASGTPINFGIFTSFGGPGGGWAFSSGTDFPSIEAFTDRDNSLHMGGSIIQQTSSNTWLLHLDDALSSDDDDNDILMQIRIVPG
jgi:hypothetical protein